jgi:hypothetical protein
LFDILLKFSLVSKFATFCGSEEKILLFFGIKTILFKNQVLMRVIGVEKNKKNFRQLKKTSQLIGLLTSKAII